jgi:DNA-binding beta-propeller fold protein YncE
MRLGGRNWGCGIGRVLELANSVAVSPDGTSVYVTSGLDVVEVFDRAANGTLTQKAGTAASIQDDGLFGCADGKALERTSSVVVSPDGTSVYVTSVFDHLLGDDGAVAVFDRAANGTLTQKAGLAGCISFRATTTGAPCADGGSSIDGPRSVAVSPDGVSVYVGARISAAVVVFDRAANGALTQKAGTAGCISSFGGLGCAAATALRGLSAVTVSPDGKSVYTASVENDAVGVLDRAADGTLTQKASPAGCISESGFGSPGGAPCTDGKILDRASSVAVSPDGKSVYVTSPGWDAVSVFDRAPADATPPTCTYTIVSGSPKRIDFTVSDAGSGISSIQITTAVNIVQPVNIPAFTVGTTSPVMFSAVKDNQAMSSRVAVVITDIDGNRASCI